MNGGGSTAFGMEARRWDGAGFRGRCGWCDQLSGHAIVPPPMSEFIEVACAPDLPVGRAKAVTVADRTIAIYHTKNGFFATDNVCPHRGGPLSEGDVIDNEIVCPWHLWSFDVATGICPGNADISVATHEVRIEGERILVRLS